MEEKNKKIRKKYWYKQYMGECPVCGRNMGWREKVNGDKPTDLTKVYIQLSPEDCYDHCI